jgi:PAS domain S-box-containing protein
VDAARVLETIEIGVVVQDAGARMMFANAYARKLLKLPLDKALSEITSYDPEWDAVSLDGSPCPGEQHPAPMALREKRVVRDVVLGIRASGQRIWVQVTASPRLDAQGTVTEVIVTFTDITERVAQGTAAAAALQKVDTKYRAVIGAMSEGVLVFDTEGRVLTSNEAGQRMLGLELSSLRERFDDKVPPGDTRAFTEEGEEFKRSELHQRLGLLTGQKTRDLVLRVQNDRGNDVWMRIRADPILSEPAGTWSGTVATFTDITEQRQAMESLTHERERLRLLTSAVPGVLFEHLERPDGTDVFPYMGVGIQALAGVGADEVMRSAQAFWARVHTEDLQRVMKVRTEVFKVGGVLDEELRLGSQDTGWRWARVRVASPRPTEAGALMFGLLLDVTEQRAVADRLHAAERREGLGLLAAGMAHNFNNILSAIVPNLDRLRADVPEALRGDIHDAWQAAQSASELVRQLTQLVRRDIAPEPEPVDCGALVADVVAFCRHTFDRGITLTSSLPPQAVMVRARRSELHQVLLTLCLNARDAMEHRAVRTLHVALTREAGHAVIAVTDSGSGMSEQTMKRLGEPFFTTREPGRGTGLGVAAALGSMKSLGGELTWTSKLDVGSTFVIRLAALPEVSAPQLTPPPPPLGAPRPLAGRRLLLIDDEPLVRRSLRRLLDRLGAEILEAGDGPEGLALLAARGDVDAVFVDLSMPEMNGGEVLKKIKERTPQLPVFILSGFVPDPDALSEATGIINKPFTNEAVRDALLAVFR